MQLKNVVPAALAVAAVSAQSDMNLTSLISSNSNLTALGSLLTAYPNVTTALASATNVTLFAPNNDAIQLLNSSGILGAAANTPNYVADLLMYHVLMGTFYAENITATPAFPHTLLNDTMYSNVTGGQVVECRLEGMTAEIISGLKNVANVTQANLNYTGGVVHVIDNVLTIPLNVSSTASAANLTAFAGALQATNLTSTLDTASDITVFAPNNAAFQTIATGLSNLSTSEITSILEYHVINGTVAYSSLLTNASIPTLGGGNVTITIEDGAVFVNSARVVTADVLISGGVLHVIDSVLNPNNTAAANGTSTAPATAYSGASSASDVPLTSGIATPTSTNSELITTETAVASGYTVVPTESAITGGGSGGSSSSSSAGAAMATGAIGAMGAAALFGGAAFLADL